MFGALYTTFQRLFKDFFVVINELNNLCKDLEDFYNLQR